MWNALAGQASVLRRLVDCWLEVLRDDIGAYGAGWFSGKKKALAGQTRRRVWWMGDLRIKYRVVRNGVRG